MYVKYGHKIQSVMSDNEAVFRSIESDLGAMGIVSNFTPSGVHNQIVERGNRILQEKVEVLKGSLLYELPKKLEREVYHYAVYLLNRTWNSSTHGNCTLV